MVISGGFTIVGAIILRDGNHFRSRGKKADATIVQNNLGTSGFDSGSYYPVIKFLTEKKEWITQELKTGFEPPIPEGTKVEVLYDPENPSDVEINSSLRLKILPALFIAAGIIGMTISILDYAQIVSWLK